MTRNQFLIVLYKKLLRPALLILAAWFAIRFIDGFIDFVTETYIDFGGVLGFIASQLAYLVPMLLFLVIVAKTLNYISDKLGIDISKDSKAMKILSRFVDIVVGMALVYLWQKDKMAAVVVFIIFLQNFIREEFPNEEPASEEK